MLAGMLDSVAEAMAACMEEHAMATLHPLTSQGDLDTDLPALAGSGSWQPGAQPWVSLVYWDGESGDAGHPLPQGE